MWIQSVSREQNTNTYRLAPPEQSLLRNIDWVIKSSPLFPLCGSSHLSSSSILPSSGPAPPGRLRFEVFQVSRVQSDAAPVPLMLLIVAADQVVCVERTKSCDSFLIMTRLKYWQLVYNRTCNILEIIRRRLGSRNAAYVTQAKHFYSPKRPGVTFILKYFNFSLKPNLEFRSWMTSMGRSVQRRSEETFRGKSP